MLLVVDIGNTNIVFGVYRTVKEPLFAHFRLASEKTRTADEYGILFDQLLRHRGLDPATVEASAIASVVPTLTPVMTEACERYCGHKPLVIGPGVKTGMPILCENPKEVGADRIVNAVAAYHRYQEALIVVDLGTATTFDAVSEKGEYLGGAIAPGIGIALEALTRRASKLPRIEIAEPKSVIGKNTVQSMQSGILYGYVGLIDGLVERMQKEMGRSVKVVATGGLAGFMQHQSKTIGEVDEMLTLEGLRIIWQMNR